MKLSNRVILNKILDKLGGSKLVSICTALTAFAAFGATILSYRSVDLNYKNSVLENRPYLSIRFLPPNNVGYDDAGDRKIQIAYSLANRGKTPASNLKYQWYVATNQDRWIQPPDEYWEKRDKEGGQLRRNRRKTEVLGNV